MGRGGGSLASARSVETTASRSGNTCSEKAPTPRGAGESGDARRRWAPGKTRAQHVNRGTRCTRCALGKRASATHRTLPAFTSAARQQQEIPPLRAHGLCDLPGASAWPNLRIALLFFFCFLPQRKTDGIIVLYGYVDVADVNADLICVSFIFFLPHCCTRQSILYVPAKKEKKNFSWTFFFCGVGYNISFVCPSNPMRLCQANFVLTFLQLLLF